MKHFHTVPISVSLAIFAAGAAAQERAWNTTLEEISSGVVSIQVDSTRAFDTERNRSSQAKAWMWNEVRDELVDDLKNDPDVKARVMQLETQVADGKLSPAVAAQELIAVFLKRGDRPGRNTGRS